jgi:hypothetical protein
MPEERPPSRTPLPPEEYRPATVVDGVMFTISLLLATTVTLPVICRTLPQLWNGRPVSFSLVVVSTWSGCVWLVPLLRAMLNYRGGVWAGVTNHSYLLRKYWQAQILILLVVGMLVSPLIVLLFSLCGPTGLRSLS